MKTIFIVVIVIGVISQYDCHNTNVNETDAVINPLPSDFHWQPAGLDSNSVVSLFQALNGSILAGTNYGLFISSDSGSNWLLNNYFTYGIITSFTDYQNDKILAGTSGQGIFISSDNGNHWFNIGLQEINVTELAVNIEGRIFAATRGNGIFINDSSKWEPAGSDINTKSFFSLLITQDKKVFAGGTGIYRSDDFGRSWQLKNKGLGNWAVLSLIADNSGRIAAGTDNGGFFLSNNNGENWVNSNNGLTNKEITSLAISNQRQIFAGTWGGGVFYTIDYGQNWTNIDTGLNNRAVQNLLITAENIIYNGTFKGVFKSTPLEQQ